MKNTVLTVVFCLFSLAVIASGGISTVRDLERLAELHHPKLDGAIIGKALYEGHISIEEALAHAR